jgi:sortase A
MGKMKDPHIGLVTPMFEGPHPAWNPQLMYESGNVFLPALDHGPAHYPGNAEPWQKGTVVFSGHRVTHTRPFNKLGNTRLGDVISLVTRWGTYRYRVIPPPKGHSYSRNAYAVRGSPCALRSACGIVWGGTGWFFRWHKAGHWLVLLACAPPGDKQYRLAVFARRISAPRR